MPEPEVATSITPDLLRRAFLDTQIATPQGNVSVSTLMEAKKNDAYVADSLQKCLDYWNRQLEQTTLPFAERILREKRFFKLLGVSDDYLPAVYGQIAESMMKMIQKPSSVVDAETIELQKRKAARSTLKRAIMGASFTVGEVSRTVEGCRLQLNSATIALFDTSLDKHLDYLDQELFPDKNRTDIKKSGELKPHLSWLPYYLGIKEPYAKQVTSSIQSAVDAAMAGLRTEPVVAAR